MFLTFLLGEQTTYAKTELISPQNQVSFSIEQNQSFQFLEKELQPNIGFLTFKELSKLIHQEILLVTLLLILISFHN